MTEIILNRPLSMDGTNSETVNLIYYGYSFMMFRNEANIIPHAEFICDRYREELAGLRKVKAHNPNATNINHEIQFVLQHLILLKTAMNLYKQKRIAVRCETLEQSNQRVEQAARVRRNKHF